MILRLSDILVIVFLSVSAQGCSAQELKQGKHRLFWYSPEGQKKTGSFDF